MAEAEDEQRGLRSEIQELETVRAEYGALRSSHQDVDERIRQLTAQRDSFAERLEELQRDSKDQQNLTMDQGAELENMRQRLTEIANSHDRALETLFQERAHRSRVECQLREREDELRRLQESAQAADSMTADYATMQTNLATIEEQMQLLTAEHDQARQELERSEQKVGDLLALVKGYKQTVEEVEGDKRQLLAQLEESQFARDEIQRTLQEHDRLIQEQQRQLDELEKLRAEHEDAQQELQLRVAEVQGLSREAEARKTRLADEEQRVVELTTALDRQQLQMSGLRQAQANLKAELESSQTQCEQLDGSLRMSQEKVAHLEQDAEALVTLRHELATVQVALRESEARTGKLGSDREQAMRERHDALQRADQLTTLTRQQELALEKLQQEKKELVSLLERHRSRRARLEAAIRQHADELAHLDDDSVLTSDAPHSPTVQGPVVGGATNPAKVPGQNVTAADAEWREPASAELLSLNEFITERDRRETMPAGSTRHDSLLGIVYTMPPERSDDLQRISGVGEALEKKLNALGVYSFKQVMDWDDVAVAEISKLLSFEDRVVREEWREQARELFKEHYHAA